MPRLHTDRTGLPSLHDAGCRQAERAMSPLYWEDIEIGTRRELGTYTFTEEEIIRFAKKYDPQVIHTDPEAAKDSIFGGLIASGWHTAAIWMKLSMAERQRAGTPT